VVPLFLLLAASVSPLPAALDLGAGEKQRQSLEFLLAATPHRGGIFLGKALAVAVTGLLGVLGFIAGIVIANTLVPELLSIDLTGIRRGAGVFLTGAGLALLLVMTISVLELVLSITARTPREAQGYFLPFLLLISGIGYTVLLTDIWYAPAWMLHTPLLNIAVLLKMHLLEADISRAMWWVFPENVGIIAMVSLIGGAILRSEWVLQRS
jgi:sodium transport system permease protein